MKEYEVLFMEVIEFSGNDIITSSDTETIIVDGD